MKPADKPKPLVAKVVTSRSRRRLLIAAITCGLAWLFIVGFLNSGFIRDASFPYTLDDIEGDWVLDVVQGDFEVAPPEQLHFSQGAGAGLDEISDGQRVAEFRMEGLGRWVFAAGASFNPLLPAGTAEAYTMTHFCPPLPAWDHLIFFPDGMPMGNDPNRRAINYERE